jgi:polyhydroxybutyrate depolymerase
MKTPRATITAALVLAIAALGVALSSHSSSRSATASESGTSTTRLPPIVYVPPRLPAGKVALVIALHGSSNSPSGMESMTGFDQLARADGFIVAYLASGSPADNWILPSDTSYVGSMIDRLEASEPIDPTRVYVTGFSAGGYESYRAGCLLSDKVAAVAPVGVSMNSKLYASCRLSRPVSALITIGSADSGHYGGYGRLPSAPAAAARWRALDGCPRKPPIHRRAPGPTGEELWSGCADGSSVGLNVVAGGGHVWPGTRLGPSSPDGRYEASAAIWAFLSVHRAGSASKPDARLLSARAVLTRSMREVILTVRVGEPLSVRASLSSRGRTVGAVRSSLTRGGAIHVIVGVARRARGGRYSLHVGLGDAYGRTLTLTRTITL